MSITQANEHVIDDLSVSRAKLQSDCVSEPKFAQSAVESGNITNDSHLLIGQNVTHLPIQSGEIVNSGEVLSYVSGSLVTYVYESGGISASGEVEFNSVDYDPRPGASGGFFSSLISSDPIFKESKVLLTYAAADYSWWSGYNACVCSFSSSGIVTSSPVEVTDSGSSRHSSCMVTDEYALLCSGTSLSWGKAYCTCFTVDPIAVTEDGTEFDENTTDFIEIARIDDGRALVIYERTSDGGTTWETMYRIMSVSAGSITVGNASVLFSDRLCEGKLHKIGDNIFAFVHIKGSSGKIMIDILSLSGSTITVLESSTYADCRSNLATFHSSLMNSSRIIIVASSLTDDLTSVSGGVIATINDDYSVTFGSACQLDDRFLQDGCIQAVDSGRAIFVLQDYDGSYMTSLISISVAIDSISVGEKITHHEGSQVFGYVTNNLGNGRISLAFGSTNNPGYVSSVEAAPLYTRTDRAPIAIARETVTDDVECEVSFLGNSRYVEYNQSLTVGHRYYVGSNSFLDSTDGQGIDDTELNYDSRGFTVLIGEAVARNILKVYNLTWGQSIAIGTYGYIGAGATLDAGAVEAFDRLNFVDYTITEIAESAQLIDGDAVDNEPNSKSMNSSTASYITSGYNGTTPYEEIEKFDLSCETFSEISDRFSDNRKGVCTTGTGTKGYSLGGIDTVPARSSTAESLTYSTESTASVTDSLTLARNGSMGLESGSNGYIAGGTPTINAVDITNVIEKILFSTEAISTVTETLDQGMLSGAGLSSSEYGYVLGGIDTSASPLDVICRMVFSTETVADIATTLTDAVLVQGSMYNVLEGFTVGGWVGEVYQSVDKLVFSDETVSSLADTLSEARCRAAGMAKYV